MPLGSLGLLSTSCPGLFAWHLQKKLFFSTLPKNSEIEFRVSAQRLGSGIRPGLFLAITCCCLADTGTGRGKPRATPHRGAVEGALHLFHKYLASACSLCSGTMLSSRDTTINDVEFRSSRSSSTHVHGKMHWTRSVGVG